MAKPLLIVVVLLLAGGAAAFKLLASEAAESRPKIDGDAYVLPKEFLLNLQDGRYAKLSVALVLPHGEGAEAEAEGPEGGARAPDGYGPLVQEALVRSIVTESLTDLPAKWLTRPSMRSALKQRILKRLQRESDVHARAVLFTDVAVQ